MATKDELSAQVQELMAWKRASDEKQSTRLAKMNDRIVHIFASERATVTEILTVLELVKSSVCKNYIDALPYSNKAAIEAVKVPEK